MISFIYIYIHVILTYLVKVNVGGMEFICISSYRGVFFIVFDSEKDSQTYNPLTLQGKLWLQWLLIQKMTPHVFSASESLYDKQSDAYVTRSF